MKKKKHIETISTDVLTSDEQSDKPLYEDKLIVIHRGKHHTTWCDGIQHWVKTSRDEKETVIHGWHRAELHRIVRNHGFAFFK